MLKTENQLEFHFNFSFGFLRTPVLGSSSVFRENRQNMKNFGVQFQFCVLVFHRSFEIMRTNFGRKKSQKS